jgi:hypothetical protein
MEYKESDFCTAEEGIQYLFKMMSIIYGARFTSHWGTMNMASVMEVWKNMIGNYLTYRPTIDFAIKNLDPSGFVVTPMAFIELCKQAGRIPVKPDRTITHQPTQEEIERNAKAREEAIAAVRAWKSGIIEKAM